MGFFLKISFGSRDEEKHWVIPCPIVSEVLREYNNRKLAALLRNQYEHVLILILPFIKVHDDSLLLSPVKL
jgi:hypothetical protein